jgi:hypothetical protein
MDELGCGVPCTPLSPTFQSSQLLTPRDLTRITIERPKYTSYQRDLLQQKPLASRLPGGVPIQFGQHPILIERDHPIEQFYTNTSLKLSAVRAHDQIIPRPLSSYSVIRKEIPQDFPAEHPYSSHREKFRVFPDTRREEDVLSSDKEIVEVPLCKVIDRAQFKGWRREEVGYYRPFSARNRAEDEERLRLATRALTTKHKRSPTYPFIVPLLDSMDQTRGVLPPVTPRTREGLSTAHKSLMRTSYQDQYQKYTPSCYTPNVLHISHTPLPENSGRQGNYYYLPVAEEEDEDREGDEEGEDNELEEEQEEKAGGKDQEECTEEEIGENDEEEGSKDTTEADSENEEELGGDAKQFYLRRREIKVETREGDGQGEVVSDSDVKEADVHVGTYGTVFASPGEELDQEKAEVHLPYIDQSSPTSPSHWPRVEPSQLQSSIPRNILSSRRYADLRDSFSRSKAMERFHDSYRDPLPDLRESSRDGRRHFINGYHAYFYH